MFRALATFIVIVTVCGIGVSDIRAQTSEFTYQGILNDGANPANGNYDLEFKLFDLLSGGAQQGGTLQRLNVTIAQGDFTVSLDFGAGALPGADRFLDIAVRPSGGGAFTPLSPRQKVNSAPYSVRSLNSASADLATNATQLDGVAASQYVITTDPRMSNARNPLANSPNYIQNTAVPQAASNFNISGTGTAGIFNAATQYNLAGSRILSIAGTNNLFAGVTSGAVNTSGVANAFFGTFAGQGNTTGGTNAFFGSSAGFSNADGSENAFLGASAGSQNSSGNFNTFAGSFAGFGNMTGSGNSFFGRDAGVNNATGFNNSFYGTSSGGTNTTGSNNTLIGHGTNFEIGNLTFATAIGSGASVGSNNTIVLGRAGGEERVHIPGDLLLSGTLTTFELSAPIISATTQFNIGTSRILGNPGTNNLFAGVGAGANSTGINNAFFGFGAGSFTMTTSGNSFFGSRAGLNQTGASNSFFGERSGQNSTGSENSFFGAASGLNNSTGDRNTFAGSQAGRSNQSGVDNVFIGANAGLSNVSGSSNSIVGSLATLSNGLTNAGAFGFRAFVTQSNSLSLGSINGTNGATADTNVGIGTTAPSEKLHLTANAGNVVIGNPGCNAGFAAVGFGPSFDVCGNYTVMGNGTDSMVNRPTGGRLFLRENNANQMTIASGGNVGIGTIIPERKLHVVGPASVEVMIESSDPGGRKWTLQSSSGGANGRFEIVDRTATANRFTILNDGNVGVGTTAPQRLFHVNGRARLGFIPLEASVAQMCFNAAGDLLQCGGSSLRWKTDISPFDLGLETVLRLRPIRFTWKESGSKDFGLGAEEVAQVAPELAFFNSKGEVEGVKYDRLSVAFINAFQEQQAQIEKQQALIELQQKHLDEQRDQIQTLLRLACSQTSDPTVCRP